MSSKTEAQQIFDNVLTLKYDEEMELTFPLDSAAESFRSALYRERKNWALKTDSKDQISITRDYGGFPFKLVIAKVPGMMSAVVKKPDGSTTDFSFKEREKPPVLIEPFMAKTELERQKDLMRNDGMSEEEIEDYFEGDKE